MMKNLILFLFLTFTSCQLVLQNTIGRIVVKNTVDFNQFECKEEFAITIPYSKNHGVPIIKVKLNNSQEEYNFLLDSGGYSTVSEEIAKLMNAKPTSKTVNSTDVNQVNEKNTFYLFENLICGEIEFKQLNLRTSNNLPSFIDGILGIDFMDNKIFYFSDSLLTIANNHEVHVDYDYSQLKLIKHWNSKYYTGINIKDKKHKLLIDTGSSHEISLSEYSGNYIDKSIAISKTMGVNSTQYSTISNFLISDLYINKNKFDTLIVSSTFPSQSENLLGFDFIKNYSSIVDFINNKIYLKKNNSVRHWHEYFNLEYKRNLSFNYTDHLFISSVQESIFNNTGILPGDIVKKINNTEVGNNLEEVQHFFSELTNQKNELKLDSFLIELYRADSIFIRKIPF